MLTTKPQVLVQVPFVEGNNSQPIPLQIQKVCKRVDFNISGPVVISSITGTVLKILTATGSNAVIFPYLLLFAGFLTFVGTRTDGTKGVKVQKVPIWFLWLQSFIENGGNGPIVSDGGMAAANFAAATYQVNINFSLYFYDPLTPVKQHSWSYFRPLCYNQQPYFLITGGKLFQANYQANGDSVATSGDTSTSSALAYTTALTISATAILVPAMKSSALDVCLDISYEYQAQFNLAQPAYNQISFADLGVQKYIYIIETVRAALGSGTAYTEAGVNTLGTANNGIIETDIGTDPIARPYEINQLQANQTEYMKGTATIPLGVTIIDEADHNLSAWNIKTFLMPGIATHFLQSQGIPAVTVGSNLRTMHLTLNPSASAFNKYKPFAKFAGQ